MLYGNSSISQYSLGNKIIWFMMAFHAGLLNVGGFLAAKSIVSHVTGYATFLGYELSEKNWMHAIGIAVVPVFFLLGAMVSGFFVDIRLKENKEPKYYISFGIIFFMNLLIFVNGILGKWGTFGAAPSKISDYIFVAILCFICGIQNGTISIVSNSVIRTTHLTGTVTDLGIGLIRIFHKDKIKLGNEGEANMMRIGLITSFIVSSIVGGFLFNHFQFYAFIVPVAISGLLFALMLIFHFRIKDHHFH